MIKHALLWGDNWYKRSCNVLLQPLHIPVLRKYRNALTFLLCLLTVRRFQANELQKSGVKYAG